MHRDSDSQFDVDDLKEMVKNTYLDFVKIQNEKKRVNNIFDEDDSQEVQSPIL